MGSLINHTASKKKKEKNAKLKLCQSLCHETGKRLHRGKTYSSRLIKNLNKANRGLKTSPTQKRRGGETYLLAGRKKKKIAFSESLAWFRKLPDQCRRCLSCWEKTKKSVWEPPPQPKKLLDFYQHTLLIAQFYSSRVKYCDILVFFLYSECNVQQQRKQDAAVLHLELLYRLWST